LEDEAPWKQVFDQFEQTQGTKIFLISKNILPNGKSIPRRTVIDLHRIRPPFVDYVDHLRRMRIMISASYLDRAEATKQISKTDPKEIEAQKIEKKSSSEPTTNENENESENMREEKENQN